MRTTRLWCWTAIVVGLGVLLIASPERLSSQQSRAAVRIDNDDIGGVVTSANGPEAGAWVIAETNDLATKYAKIVVTDDQGRYVIPDLPKAIYNVWVRGYGLVDSAKVRATPGKILNLQAVVAPNEAAAAEYYPAIYWYSMLKIPEKSEFPLGKASSQGHWLAGIKTHGCISCHQLGNKATRVIPKELGEFKSSMDAWQRRVLSGQASEVMMRNLNDVEPKRALALFADWTDRIAAGALPKSKPSRPQGVERNVVITLWDWATPKAYLHDEIASDKRNPMVNANGLLYGSPEDSTDFIPILDPVRHKATEAKAPVRDSNTPDTMFIATANTNTLMLAPSPYWGTERVWQSQASVHNPMFDEKGRVWVTSRIRPPQNPTFCKKGSDHPSAKLFPIERAGRHLAVYDPKTKKFTLIDTCFSTHHLIFGEDANNTLWLSSGGAASGVLGWLNTKTFDKTGDEQKSQGWTAFILDTNGNGKRDEYVEPDQPVDPTKDKRIVAGYYGIGFNPMDGSIWGSVLSFPGAVVRVSPGDNPPATALAEIYEVPWNEPKAVVNGYGPRGMDIDRNGVVWVPLASGHLASFDRRKCKGPLNGPTATGKHCPEGWTLLPFPGPQFDNVSDSGSVQASYYTWVDQHDIFGLGKNVPFATGNLSDSLEAFVDGKFVTLRIPYPMGFHAKGMDGRIDDPKANWKGKGLWSAYAGRATHHIEGGKGTKPKVVKFQLRPDPLAK
ncbi:MAG TPA: carboxypeptidase-like regulatory domain-containing protein [Verrucomicrobiae bacterium]|nr:carboxypeptidase-like regulatory domain-containing protein [Verrucomicrobiae bacterium]